MAVIGKSHQIVNQIHKAIMSGRWAPGDRLPGEVELQAEFGVSRNTLRDALILLANDGIIVRKHGMGTFVAERVKKSGSHIVLTTDARRLSSYTGYWHRELVDEAQKQISNAGYKAVLAAGNGTSEEEFMSSINFSTNALDSDIVGAIDLSNRECVHNYLTTNGIPFIQIEGAVSTSTYSVVVDLVQMVETAMKVFKEYGYDDFAIMCYSFNNIDSPFQREYIRLANAAARGRKDRIVTIPDAQAIMASDAFKEWWSRSDRPNAMFFMDDSIFDVASRTILELGIKVPDELAILTHTNVGKLIYFPTRLARIEFDPVVAVTQAWDMLRKLLNSEPVVRTVVSVPPTYIEGDSLLGKPVRNQNTDFIAEDSLV